MAKQSIAIRTTNVTTANASVEIIASATQAVRVTRIDICPAGTNGGTYAIGRPAAKGITPTSPVTLLRHDAGDNTPTATVALAWGTGPTVPAAFLARASFPAAIGTTATFDFPEGIVIPISGSLVVWNLSATDVADVTITVSTSAPRHS